MLVGAAETAERAMERRATIVWDFMMLIGNKLSKGDTKMRW
jgi:hypothetical protein